MGLLRNRSFLLMYLGMAVSLLGDALYGLVIPLWVVQATGSARAMAVVTGAGTLATLFLAPLAGTVADRSDRRRVMIASDLARAAVVLGLAAALQGQVANFALLAGGAAALAVAGAFFTPAYAAAQSGLVHPDDLTRALSLFQMLRQTVAFAGPSLAGVVAARLGSAGALGLDGVSFLVSALCIGLARLAWSPAAPKRRRPFWHDFREGLSTITDHPAIRRTVLLSCGVNLAGAMFGVLLPVIAVREWQLAPAQFGLFSTISPAGVMLGLLLVTSLGRRIGARGPFMLWALLAMGLTNVSMVATVHFWPFAALLFLGGVTFGLSNVMFAAMYRALVPQDRQGRFFGLLGAVAQALMPVGFGAAGLLADAMSPFAVAGLAGALVVALAVWGLTTPGLRDLA